MAYNNYKFNYIQLYSIISFTLIRFSMSLNKGDKENLSPLRLERNFHYFRFILAEAIIKKQALIFINGFAEFRKQIINELCRAYAFLTRISSHEVVIHIGKCHSHAF